MAKQNTDFKDCVILFIIVALLYDCIYGNKVVSIGHNIFQKTGVSQQIERFESIRQQQYRGY